jgi:hypothetical protein
MKFGGESISPVHKKKLPAPKSRGRCEGNPPRGKNTLGWNDKSDREGSADRRRDPRFFVNAPVEITNLDGGVDLLAEQVIIENIGDLGCRFSMRGPVREGDAIAIQLLAQDGTRLPDEPVKFFEVMWVARGMEISMVGAQIMKVEKFAACKLALESRLAINSSK